MDRHVASFWDDKYVQESAVMVDSVNILKYGANFIICEFYFN